MIIFQFDAKNINNFFCFIYIQITFSQRNKHIQNQTLDPKHHRPNENKQLPPHAIDTTSTNRHHIHKSPPHPPFVQSPNPKIDRPDSGRPLRM